MPPTLDELPVLAELDLAKVKYDWAGVDEVKIKCPFHDDEKPSCGISVSKRVFCCQVCNASGDIVTLLAKLYGITRAEILEELGTRYDLNEEKTIDPDVIERWHQSLLDPNTPGAERLRAELYKRAVSDSLIQKYCLGCEDNRITIPVKNERGCFVNVRKYLPGAGEYTANNPKMRNMRGRGAPRWYPIEQLKYDTVVMCGGEIKAIVAAEQLNSRGIGAAWVTHGEKLIPTKLLEKLKDKCVAFCLDVDAAGQKATEDNCKNLRNITNDVLLMELPLDREKYPKGDINDYAALGGDLFTLFESAKPWIGVVIDTDDSEPQKIHLGQASNARYTGKRLQVTAVATMMDTAPYVVPRQIEVKCDKAQKGLCENCPVFSSSDNLFTVSPESPAILCAVHATKLEVKHSLIEGIGIPIRCPVCQFDVIDHYNAEDVRLAPQLEITNRITDQKTMQAICIGDGLELNDPYEMQGRMWPHPKTQQSTLLIGKYKRTLDSLSSYEPKDLEILDLFRPTEWSVDGIQAQLNSLYADLENAVTRIWQRQDIHLAVDLAYHSPLFLQINNENINGWVQTLVIGDSAQGKSEIAQRLMKHYNLGERIEVKNSTAAGLLGGLKGHGSSGRFLLEWGLLVKHDKRLLIMDEIKGMPNRADTIGKMTDARSSGIAELVKIEKYRAHARTRQVWISNACGNRDMASYGYGVEAVMELIGSPEDVRRFDFVLAVAKDEVDRDEIARRTLAVNGAHPRYSSDLCRALILWVWTRTPTQSIIDKDVFRLIVEESTKLSEEFTDAIPIVDRGSMRYKLARIAAAIAGRTFSTSEDRLSINIRSTHVEWAANWLRDLYVRKSLGYAHYTAASQQVNTLVDVDVLRKHIQALPFPREFVDAILRADKFEKQDVQDWCGWDLSGDVATLISLLVRKHAIRRSTGNKYQKSAAFVDFLKGLISNLPDRPAHLPEGREF